MNARHYDPYTGRFVSADSIIPDPSKPAALNRYAYVYGNPVSIRDPSGHEPISGAVIMTVAAIYVVAMNVDSPELQLAATIALSAVGGIYMSETLVLAGVHQVVAPMIAAGTMRLATSVAQSGRLDGEALRSAAWSAASAGVSHSIGHEWGLSGGERFAAHGMAQGLFSLAQGGSFTQGAVSGLVGHSTGHLLGGLGWDSNSAGHIVGRTVVAGTFGYIGAKATGGDGSRGAIAAATVHLYNSEKGGAREDIEITLFVGEKVTGKNTVVTNGNGGLKIQVEANHTNSHPLLIKAVESHERQHLSDYLEYGVNLEVLSSQPADLIVRVNSGAINFLERRGYQAEIDFLTTQRITQPTLDRIYLGRDKINNVYKD
jgi:hypothetical protein